MREKIFNILLNLTLVILLIITFSPITNALITKSEYLSEDPFNGYTFFAPEYSKITYLMDNDKNIIHTWESNYFQALGAYLLEDGSIIRSCLPYGNPNFFAGGITGRIEIINWDGELVWEFEYSNNYVCLHHDIKVLPNGNVLMLAWELKTFEQAIAAGRNPNNIPQGKFWPDSIIEVKPTFPEGGNIVWQWHSWDHLIQDFNQARNNFGKVEDHPELIDINFFSGGPDWMHTNSVDYNEEFDQIMISVHNFNEIWVIDHSTTTIQAAGHTGGNYGKGGDILYRWGNPRAYRAGNINDQKLFGQHDAQWIKPGCPGEGNILIFNNGLERPAGQYSSVEEINPPIDESGNYYLASDSAYGPNEQTWIYYDENPIDFYSGGISGASRLPNGNTLICQGNGGYFFEVTTEKEVIWDYLNPYPNVLNNNVFKIQRYPENYPGLDNLNLKPIKPNTPNGPSTGKDGVEYLYTSVTTDPQDEQIYYLFDWNDGTNSGWIGPYNSGITVEETHIWKKAGNYKIKVMAKDIKGHESIWSDPLPVSMAKEKVIIETLLNYILNLFKNCQKINLYLNLVVSRLFNA